MIDHQTVERIKNAANIVEVVSEFVTLRKSGANYKGLCPFHNEKTPSFMVSPARNTCHCFGCGKGGAPISFIMEHEQMTYPEALRWLANKYHIEIQERELTDEEKREQSERESMFIINEYALKYFEDTLHNHPDGVAIGMQYFRQRGIRDDIIKKFQLGFDLPNALAFGRAALQKGYKEEFITKVGICYKNDRGELIDRYAGRVIFPWIGVSGKVVGFGGRKLDAATKGVQQKYVNSPDSEIYHKDRELYGIYQAKHAINKEDCVYMVEGYTDVIAMHQAGIENVVANSGTALSVHQINILHRFTSNIVLLYDGDAAGIHAALRGTDMLLAEGMNLRVLLLPDGDDPDSFARKHTASDFRKYIDEHQQDFIDFKTELMLRGITDPKKRNEAISSIVRSISFIPEQLSRNTYITHCAHKLQIDEAGLVILLNKYIRQDREKRINQEPVNDNNDENSNLIRFYTRDDQESAVEQMIIQLIIRHGEVIIFENAEDEDGRICDLTVAQFFSHNLGVDGLSLSSDLYNRILAEAVAHSGEPGFVAEQYFINHDDIAISQLAANMATDKFHLAESQQPRNDVEALRQRSLHLVLDFRMDYLERRLKAIRSEIATATNDAERLQQLMSDFKDASELRNSLARRLGSNIIL